MAVRTALSVLAVLALSVAPGAAPRDPARSFLQTAFKLSSGEIDRVDKGEVVARTLDVAHRREIATLGVVRIAVAPSVYVERLRDIATFKRTDDVLQIGTFGVPAQLTDLDALTLDEGELRRLRECEVENCGLRLSAEGIERFRRGVDWSASDSSRRATGLMRQILVEYVTRYRDAGGAAAMEYADTSARLNVGREFASLVDADSGTWRHAAGLRRHLLEYPAVDHDATTSDFVYWSSERVHGQPTMTITHVAIAQIPGESPVNYAIASKQIYAMHYYDASLGLTLLVRDPAGSPATTYVVYLNRSRIDLFDGVLGGAVRRIVARRARGIVSEQLARLQRTLVETRAARSR